MKIRITEPGWGGFTGHLGTVEFANGTSVDDIGRGDAAALAGIVAIEDIATGKNPSWAQRIIDGNDTAAIEKTLPSDGAVAPVVTPVFTKEALEAIADADGIKGLRDIADPLGLKANSIAELIAKILESQEG